MSGVLSATVVPDYTLNKERRIAGSNRKEQEQEQEGE